MRDTVKIDPRWEEQVRNVAIEGMHRLGICCYQFRYEDHQDAASGETVRVAWMHFPTRYEADRLRALIRGRIPALGGFGGQTVGVPAAGLYELLFIMRPW
jgi:hypothetical protein